MIDAVEAAGGFSGDSIPNKAFFSKNDEGYSIPKVFMTNTKGDNVPIKKVRIREMLSGVVQVKNGENQYVNLRNNHHVLIYLNQSHEYCEHVVTFWEAVRRFRFGEPVFQLPEDGVEFVTTVLDTVFVSALVSVTTATSPNINNIENNNLKSFITTCFCQPSKLQTFFL